MRELLTAAGFTDVICQQVVRVNGRLLRMDFRIAGTPFIIEADGYAHHSGKDDFERDRRRNNALAARGFVLFHWTWDALQHRPEQLIAELHQALRARGWSGLSASAP